LSLLTIRSAHADRRRLNRIEWFHWRIVVSTLLAKIRVIVKKIYIDMTQTSVESMAITSLGSEMRKIVSYWLCCEPI